MKRSELINELKKHIDEYGDGDIYAIVTSHGMCTGVEIDSIGLDAADNTVIDF